MFRSKRCRPLAFSVVFAKSNSVAKKVQKKQPKIGKMQQQIDLEKKIYYNLLKKYADFAS